MAWWSSNGEMGQVREGRSDGLLGLVLLLRSRDFLGKTEENGRVSENQSGREPTKLFFPRAFFFGGACGGVCFIHYLSVMDPVRASH